MIRPLAATFLALASCGGGHSAPTHPDRPAPHGDAGIGERERPPTDAECDQLVAHAVDLGMAEQRATKAADRVPTAQQEAAVRSALQERHSADCPQLSRRALACALAAATTAELAACDQASRSSSTSNSSVAPGGITPPAPRLP